ncbi:hypothetical protein CA12_02950 [Alienimonas californiensis]|uniref:Uncharacterized protein n=1 Tax=Alienimonas californiensis TaxID=2527989 RepID=A0A517P4F3_9PLAN|nr:hypothetical protein CA12_02950 [Alienimonas californiensis]
MQRIAIGRLAGAYSLPFLLYALVVGFRLSGVQPTAEGKAGDVLTAVYLLFGASVAYTEFLRRIFETSFSTGGRPFWWWTFSLLLGLFAGDEVFIIPSSRVSC